MTTNGTLPTSRRITPGAGVLIALALLAALVFAVRAARTAAGDGMPPGESAGPGVALASVAALLALVGAALAVRSARVAAIPLALALVLELTVLGSYAAPPRLLTAIPLLGALAVAVPGPRATSPAASSASAPRGRRWLSVIGLIAMAPVGFLYLMSGLVVPGPWVFGLYALYALLLAGAVWLARRRSPWVLAVAPVAFGLWQAILVIGERTLGWTA